jgi:membrane protease subunit (stomatin/prohibitin family)
MGRFEINFNEEDRARLVAANAEIAKANRGVKVAQAQAQARQFELDQKFGQDARYVKELAGNYQNYAAGQAMMGAGQGMAQHGVDGGVAGAGIQMAMGVNMAQAMSGAMQNQPQFGGPQGPAGAPPQAPPDFSAAGLMVTCSKCQFKQASGKFCAECGTPLAQPKKFCSNCGTELIGNAKFCSNCGTQAAAPGGP